MFRQSLGILAILLPLTIQVTSASAQSWKDWAQENPTYNQSSPAPSKSVAPKTQTLPKPAPSPRGPASQAVSQPASSDSFNGLSTHNPLFEQQYLAGCQQNSQLLRFCKCTLTEIQNNYTFQEVLKIAAFMERNNELPSEMYDVAKKCIS